MKPESPSALMHRRRFLQHGGLVSLSAVASAQTITATDAATTGFSPIDYGGSFIIGKWPGNRVRFWVESRTRIIDEQSGRHEDFYQCASCKSESTFASKDLFSADNYDFMPVFGPEDGVIFRRKAWLNPDYRTLKKSAGLWDGQIYKLRRPRTARLLATNAEVRAASHEALPIVAQTEIADATAGLRAIIEFPVKTLNIHDERDMYQVDTGPVALPDLSRRHPSFAASLSLAFVAFNAPAFADFVIEDVTALKEHDTAQVRHYTRLLTLPATNRLFVLQS